MQFSERQVNGVSIINISGDLTVSENPGALREKVVALLLRGERRILLNLRNMRRMDSACLGEIVESYKTAASNGAVLKLAEIGPDLRHLLHTTALDTIFESYDTEKEAITSFAKMPLVEPGRTVLSAGSLWSDK